MGARAWVPPGARAPTGGRMANEDETRMREAIHLAAGVRASTSPNPWVGALIVTPDGRSFGGATQPPGGLHAEAVALAAAGPDGARGATVYVTLEPCSHHGRT